MPRVIPSLERPLKKRVLRLGLAAEMVGLPHRSVGEKHNPASRAYDDTFPKPIKLSDQGTLGWYEDELADWLLSRPRAGVTS